MRRHHIVFLLPLLVLLTTCTFDVVAPPPQAAVTVYASAETDPVESSDDAADDPAIWIHSVNPEQSLIIGTDKQQGLGVYNLGGELVQFIAAGRTNNVDLRKLSGETNWDAVAAASNRTNNTISLFAINSAGELTWLRSSEITTGLTEVYGLCMHADSDQLYVFVNDTDGSYQQWQLLVTEADSEETGSVDDPVQIQAELVREFSVPSQPEGCVADDQNRRLFLGVEEEGIRVVSTDPAAEAILQSVMDIDNDILAADVEGMSLYEANGGGYLVVSSQGNYSYAVFERSPPFAYQGSFVVADAVDGSIDGSQETDGLAVTHLPLGSAYPAGLLVVQDGENTLPAASQNFKYISWQNIESALEL